MVGQGTAIVGAGVNLNAYARAENYSYPGTLAIMGDLSLGNGTLTFAAGTYNPGQLALMGNNSGTTGAMTLGGQILVGTPTAFGSNANVTLTGPVSPIYYHTNLMADVDMGAGKLTLKGNTLVKSTGVLEQVGGRARVGYDGEFAATDTTRFGTITAKQYDLQSGTIAVTMHGGTTQADVDSVTKTTGGDVTLSANNDYVGVSNILNGKLIITKTGALGAFGISRSHTSISSGTLQIGSDSSGTGIFVLAEELVLGGLGYNGGGALSNRWPIAKLTGAISLSAPSSIETSGLLTVDSGAPIIGAHGLTLTGAGPIVVNRSINTGGGSLTKSGTAQATLNADSNFSGITTVNTTDTLGNGRLIVNCILSGGGDVVVNANSVFGGTGTVAGKVTLNPSTSGNRTTLEVGQISQKTANNLADFNIGGALQINGAATISIKNPNLYLASPGQTDAPLEVAGDLILGAASSVIIDLNKVLFFYPNKYHLIKYGRAGALTAAEFSKFTPANPSPGNATRSTFSVLVNNSGYIDITVSGQVLYWKGQADAGGTPSLWGTSATASQTNWSLSAYDGTGFTASTTKFLTNDTVVFDDSADLGGPTDVTVSGAQTVSGMLINNSSSKAYSFASAGITSLNDVVKSGNGMVTFHAQNSFPSLGFQDGTIKAGVDNPFGAACQVDVGVVGDETKTPRLCSNGPNARILANSLRLLNDQFIIGDATNSGLLTLLGPINLGAATRVLTTDSDVLASGVFADATYSVAQGTLRKRGSAKLTLSADNAFGVAVNSSSAPIYNGLIINENGTLQIGNGGMTGSLSGNIENHAILIFNPGLNNNSTYDAVLSGSGTMDKQGAGKLTLNNNSTMTGLITVSAGTLLINGSIASPVQVNALGTLGGSGRINGNVTVYGTHSPGNSPGIQTFAGDLSYSAGSSIKWELSDNTNQQAATPVFDNITVGGNLSFTGATSLTLDFKPATGPQLVDWTNPFWSQSKQWEIITVGGATTGFGNLTLASPIPDWIDKNNAQFGTVLPGGSFTLSSSGGSIYLNYSAGVLAAPQVSNVILANTHVGVDFTPGLAQISNNAAVGSDSLDATIIGSVGGNVVLPGSASALGIVAAGTGTIGISLASPNQIGIITDTANIAFVSQPSGTTLAPQSIQVTGIAYEYAAPLVPVTVDVGKVRLGLATSAFQTFQAASVAIANQATSSTYGESLAAAWSTPQSSNVVTAGTIVTPIAPGGSSSILTTSLSTPVSAGLQSGSATLALTSVAVSSSGLGNTILSPATIGVTGTAYNAAVGSIALANQVIDLGHVRVGQAFAARSIQVSNTAVTGAFTEVLDAVFDASDAGVVASGSVAGLVAGSSSQAMSVNWSQTATAGVFNKNTTIRMSTSGSGLTPEAVGTQLIQITATVDEIASIVAPSPVYSGRVHVGGSFNQVDVAVTNGVAGATLENLSVAVKTSALPAGLSGWGSASGLAAGQTSANGIQAQITDTTTSGDVTKVLTISGQSISQNLTLAPIDLPDATVNITGLAYSGKSTWLGGNNDWTDGSVEAHWARWQRLGGIPGRDGVLSVGDTATFAGATSEAVRLNGLSPELQALIFSGNVGATLTAAASETFALGKGGLLAEVKAEAGTNYINVPVSLYDDLQVTATSGASVSFAGVITAISASSISVLGNNLASLGGTVDFSNTVGGTLALGVQAATFSSSLDQSFGATTLKSGSIISSKVSAGAVNLTFASVEKVASGISSYDVFMLGDASNTAKLSVGLSSAAYVDVKGGDLRNNASVAAAIHVRSGAVLGGIGSSAVVAVSDGGKFAPGNISASRTSLASGYSFGAYAADSVTLSNSSIFNVSINATSNTSLSLASGPSLLNGQLLVSYFGQTLADANVNASSVYTIITNGLQVRNGTFSDVSFDAFAGNAFPTLTPHARYFSDHVELYFTELTVPGPGLPDATDVNLGSTHVGQAFKPGVTTIYNNATSGYGTINASLAGTGSTPAVVIPPSVVSGVLPGANKTSDVTLATPTTFGDKAGQILVTFTSQPGSVDVGSKVINVTGTVYEYASTNLPGSVDLGSIRIGSSIVAFRTFQAATVPVINLATSANYGEKLSASWGPTSSLNVITGGSISNLAPQASSSALSLNLNSSLAAGAYSETATLNLTSVAVSGSGLQNTDTSQVIGVLGKVYNPAAGSTISTLNLGTTRVGTNFATKQFAVSNTAVAGAYTETLKADFISTSGNLTTSGSLTSLAAGQSASTLGIGSSSVTTPGLLSGTTTVRFTTEAQSGSGLLNEVVGSQSITVTGTVAAPGVLKNDQTARVRSTGTVLANAVDSGRVHVGGSFGQVDVHVKNEQINPAWVAFTETLAGVTAASSAAGFSYTHATLTTLLPTVNDTTTYKAAITDTVTSGEIFKTLRFSANSISLDGSLAPLVVSPLDVQVMGLAYTGRGTWIASSGNWTSGTVDADWDRWELLGGIPGIDGTLSNADTASFGGAGANTVTLSAVSPRLKALNFSSVAGTTLSRAGTEQIDLGLGLAAGETVSMSVSGGQHLLQMPVTLHKDLTIDVGSQSKLTFGSLVTTALGVTSLSVTGAGSIDFLFLTGATPLNLSLRGATVSTGVNQTLGALDLQSGTLKSSAAGLSGSNINASSLVKSTSGTVYLGDKEAPSKLFIAGTLTLADVTAGVLRNNANLQAPVTVRANATLGGVGNSLAVSILNDGHLAPGNSIGTYTTTSLTLNPTSNYDVEFNRAGADKTIVTNGPTVRAGKINVIFLNDPNVANAADFKDKVFIIIDNTGHTATGTFAASDVAFDPATASAFPSYLPKVRMFDNHTELYFLLTQNFGTPRTISSLPSIMGRTQSMFVHSIAGDPYARLLARGPSSARGVTQNSFLSSKDNLDEAVSGAQDNTWVEGYAQTIQARQGSGNWGYDYQLGGVAAGIDLIRDQDWVMGLAFGMSQSEAKHEYNRDKTSATAYDLGLYTAATGDDSTVSFVAFYSNYDVTHTRQVDMDFTTRPASGKPKAFRTGVELGYDTNVFRTPDSKTYLRMGLGAGVAHRDGFTEKGEDAIIMNFDAVNMPYFQLDMGMGYSTDLFEGDKTWQLFGEGMFTRHVVSSNPTCQARFVNAVGGSGEVTVPSPEYTYIQFQPTVGVSWREGLGSAEFKVFAEIRGGKTAPGASASYKLRF